MRCPCLLYMWPMGGWWSFPARGDTGGDGVDTFCQGRLFPSCYRRYLGKMMVPLHPMMHFERIWDHLLRCHSMGYRLWCGGGLWRSRVSFIPLVGCFLMKSKGDTHGQSVLKPLEALAPEHWKPGSYSAFPILMLFCGFGECWILTVGLYDNWNKNSQRLLALMNPMKSTQWYRLGPQYCTLFFHLLCQAFLCFPLEPFSI